MAVWFRALDNMLDATQHHGLGWGGFDDVPCTWQHVGCYATWFGSKNQVVLGALIWGFLILNYIGNWHSILLPHSSGVIRMLMLNITFSLQRNTISYKPSIFHGPKNTRPSTRRAPSSLSNIMSWYNLPKNWRRNHLWARSLLKFHQPQNQQLDTKRIVGFQKESMIHLHQISGMARVTSHPKRRYNVYRCCSKVLQQSWWIDEDVEMPIYANLHPIEN